MGDSPRTVRAPVRSEDTMPHSHDFGTITYFGAHVMELVPHLARLDPNGSPNLCHPTASGPIRRLVDVPTAP